MVQLIGPHNWEAVVTGKRFVYYGAAMIVCCAVMLGMLSVFVTPCEKKERQIADPIVMGVMSFGAAIVVVALADAVTTIARNKASGATDNFGRVFHLKE